VLTRLGAPGVGPEKPDKAVVFAADMADGRLAP
jgi:hypothetical protein